ncbi:MAG: hypothetical protein ACR2PI_07485 [Hyphomicrobiaceae bacterium]
MPFVIGLPGIIAAPSPDLSVGAGPTPVIRPSVKVALCMKWLFLKITASKQKPVARVAATFEGFDELKAQTAATMRSVDLALVPAVGRCHKLRLDEPTTIDASGLSALADSLQIKHSAVICIFTSSKNFSYPVAGYRSGGTLGKNPHIYLFFPGFGEFKGIKTSEFSKFGGALDRGVKLEGSDRIVSASLFQAHTFTLADALNEPGSDHEDNVDLGTLTRAAAGGAVPGQIVVEDGQLSIAGLAQSLEQNSS